MGKKGGGFFSDEFQFLPSAVTSMASEGRYIDLDML